MKYYAKFNFSEIRLEQWFKVLASLVIPLSPIPLLCYILVISYWKKK